MSKKYKIGYTQGVFDMFHIGHLNLIKNAKKNCEFLIVGVNSDSLVESYKHLKPNINENDRATIINNIKGVDKTIIVDTLDKKEIYNTIKFDCIFIGDDWINDARWQKTVEEMREIGVDVVFLPYTKKISSTALRKKLGEQNS